AVLQSAGVIVLTAVLAPPPLSTRRTSSRRTPSSSATASPSVAHTAASTPPSQPGSISPPPAAATGPLNVYAAPASGVFSPAVAGIAPRVYVPNVSSGTVSIIDPRTFKVVRTLVVGGKPHHITPSWDLRHLYVDNT